MAKVTGPLFSMSASGQLGKAIVHFGWKGLNVVRQYVIPSNPQSATQGSNRIFLGGTGRAVGTVAKDSAFAQKLVDLNLVVAPNTKQSMLVAYILNHYLTDLTSYVAQLALLTAHTAYTSFGAAADLLGITEFDLDYATASAYNKALGVYLIAKSAQALGFTASPYSINITAWTSTQINSMISSFTA
ncbi:MAG: hypothetical protein WCI04_03305 [archaeon]